MNIFDLLFVIEKITRGIRDEETSLLHFDPLWKSAFLLDAFKSMLQAFLHENNPEEYQKSFEIGCHFTCPEFDSILKTIDIDTTY
jgi:hypothetical protein